MDGKTSEFSRRPIFDERCTVAVVRKVGLEYRTDRRSGCLGRASMTYFRAAVRAPSLCIVSSPRAVPWSSLRAACDCCPADNTLLVRPRWPSKTGGKSDNVFIMSPASAARLRARGTLAQLKSVSCRADSDIVSMLNVVLVELLLSSKKKSAPPPFISVTSMRYLQSMHHCHGLASDLHSMVSGC